MRLQRTIIILMLFFFSITAIRLIVVYAQKPIEQPYPAQGILDLRGMTLPSSSSLTLAGEWAFYPSRFVQPDELDSAEAEVSSPPAMVQVPGPWRGAFADSGGDRFRYGTYRLRILLGGESQSPLKIRFMEIDNAAAVYVNGQLAAGAGSPSIEPGTHEARRIPIEASIDPDDREIDVIIHVSSHAGTGGVKKIVRFGTAEAIDRYTMLSEGQQMLLCVVLLVHGVYGLLLYGFGPANRGLLYFSLLIASAIGCVLCADDRILYQWLPIPYEWSVKITLISYIGVAAFIPLVLKYISAGAQRKETRGAQWFAFYCAADAAFVLASPSWVTLAGQPLILGLPLILMVIVSFGVLRPANQRKANDTIFLLLACTSLGANIWWTMAGNRLVPYELMHYPFDLIITLFVFAAFWFKQFFRTVEQSQQLAQQLQLANMQKDDFLVSTSHELRNPLHGILNIAQSLLEDPAHPAPDPVRRKLGIQVAVARRMSLMLDDLLDAARLRDNLIRLRTARVDVQTAATGAADIIRHMAAGKPIAISVDIDREFPAVRADEHRLTQILFNLLHNAVKFTSEGSVTIEAEQSDGMALLRVRDTGIGIDEETQRRIFQPYEQGNADMAAVYGGFGIGLSVCKQLVELHGGTIKVESAPNTGTVFTFTLPLATEDDAQEPQPQLLRERKQETAAASETVAEATTESSYQPAPETRYPPVPATAAPAGARPAILVVDDDGLNLQVLSDLLGMQYDVTTASSGWEATAIMEKQSFDLFIVDVMMPQMSGYELTRRIRERTGAADAPILLLTARTRAEDIAAGFDAGASDHIAKPVDAVELRARVRAWVELKRAFEDRLRMEAAWLQAQIQPHFLFNTINSIAALGTLDTGRMQVLLEHFSHYLRTSFDFHNTDQAVPLERELQLVQHYLYIEKERFGSRLHIEWALASGITFNVPPLSIQTLVENAVNHGIMRRPGGGTVSITVVEHHDCYEVAIRDNGPGMDNAQLQKLLDPADTARRGIGLRNTSRRLRQFYGSRLRISSTPGEGTTVAFHIQKTKT